MVNFSIFGGHEGQLSPDKRVYVTIFGGCDLRRPTMVRQVLELRRRTLAAVERPSCFFLTLFGGVHLKYPTLAEEYTELFDALRSGTLTLEEWDRAAGQAAAGLAPRVSSLTVFGGLGSEDLPDDDAELEALALQRHVGAIPPAVAEMLMLAIGHGGAQRISAVRFAAAAALAGPPAAARTA